ncbi:hypothetical protein E6W39_12880 [Kitasatospora acidiphila]|uniref:Uncharacterized protein n=1 Tax=Kitasatospora acidiphila TaxID=2567942 RepID=A0A540W1W0_9ACTN|nr:hypothetical protein [Kitasatospora acidiphila]TQF02991.1 hypothetical protein E6W39_12880 [Kitasatospora acidiphila]
MTSRYQAHIAPQRADAEFALDHLRTTLALDGLALPSCGLAGPSFTTGTVLVELGRARADVVLRIADLLLAGITAQEQ